MKISFEKSHQPQAGWSLLETFIAIILVGFGLAVWSKMQGASGGLNRNNANMVQAGQLIEQNVESMRVAIARDSVLNWPPKDTTFTSGRLKFSRTITKAVSPKDATTLNNVVEVKISVAWGKQSMDSLKVTTYVAKKF
jgi:Tfp pilus assembly protein PilV